MEESREIQKLYSFFQGIIYVSIALEVSIIILLPNNIYPEVVNHLFLRFSKFIIYQEVIYSKLLTFFLIIIVSVGTKARKDVELNVTKHIMLPLILGFLLFFGALFFYHFEIEIRVFKKLTLFDGLYILSSFMGVVLIHISLDNISKRIKSNLLKDRFNIENESFWLEKWLNNPNLFQVLCANLDIGSLRESFFVSQLSYSHEVHYYHKADFIIDEKYIFEIGGPSKGYKQLEGLSHAYLAIDDIESGFDQTIPLWLFGFLY